MSTSTVRHEPLARALSDVVSPEDLQSGVQTWLGEHAGARLRAVYVVDGIGALHRDDRFDDDPSSPDHLPSATIDPTEGHLVAVDFRDRRLGALLLDRAPSAEIVAALEGIGAALFRTLVLDDTQSDNERMREQLFYLDEMGTLIGRLDLELLLVNILELTSTHLGADIGSITLTEDGGLATAVDWGLPHEALVGLHRADGTPVVDAAISERTPLFLRADQLVSDDGRQHRFDSILVLPLCTNDDVWGTINLVSPTRVSGLDDPVLESIRSGVGLAATAVENALLVDMKLSREREQEQLKLGHQIQSGLLPSEPPLRDGIDLDGSSVSATMIGGDYFDYFDLPDGRLGVVVADVSGKGVPAGLIMTATRALFRATSTRHSRPAPILAEVNRLLCAEGFGTRFVTAVFASIDPAHGEIEYATAGHDAPSIWFARRETVRSEAVPALPLGLRPHVEYESRSVSLSEGDVMLFFTDGVSEAMNSEREQFGLDRLHDVLRVGASEDAAGIRDRILAALEAHCGATPRHDDTTLVVVRKTAPDDSRETPSEEPKP